MRLFNTLSRQVEEFVPLQAPVVKLYACGITVNDYAHLGHLRKYSLDDVLVRLLRHHQYQVKFVRNVTDVGHLTSDGDTGEDKLEKGAKKYGQDAWQIARQFEAFADRSLALMGNTLPDVTCRATEHIKEQIALVEELERRGHTYVIEGDGVYFDTSTFPEYGQLAKLDLQALKEGARVDIVAGKRNPSDFALWKFERVGENRAMSWPSPWSRRGFPGWHIECSAMSMKYLGAQLDVHTGGIEHIPVHHTNEIAQSEAASGKQPFVKYWMHHNHLKVDGEKMSKSLGNVFSIDDILERKFHPLALRLFFLTAHYRSELNFTWETMAGAQTAYEKLIKQVASWPSKAKSKAKLSKAAAKFQTDFWQAMDNDLDTPQALVVMWAVVKDNKLSTAEKRKLLTEFDEVLAIGLSRAEAVVLQLSESRPKQTAEIDLPAKVKLLVQERLTARTTKDWAKADQLRQELQKLGYLVKDTAEGQQVFQQSSHSHS